MKKMNLFSKKQLFAVLIVATIIVVLDSCGKDPEEIGGLEPISILLPSTNPATVIKNTPIPYKITCTTDEYIDSIQVFYQADSLLVGQSDDLDTLIFKKVFPVGSQKTIETIEGSYKPVDSLYPAVGKKIYMRFMYKTKTRNYRKVLTLNVQ